MWFSTIAIQTISFEFNFSGHNSLKQLLIRIYVFPHLKFKQNTDIRQLGKNQDNIQ